MDDLLIAGMKLDGLDVALRVEAEGNDEALENIAAIGRDGECLRHGNFHVGLAGEPSGGELGRLRRMRGVALRRAVRRPIVNERDLRIGEAALVVEVADSGLGFPRRHVAFGRDGRDERGSFRGVLVSQQGKGRDLARTMA